MRLHGLKWRQIDGRKRIPMVTAQPPGSTGNLPVPRGDSPRGTGKDVRLFLCSPEPVNAHSLPSGQWPDGTGESPVPPTPISEFGLNSPARAKQNSFSTIFFSWAAGDSSDEGKKKNRAEARFSWCCSRDYCAMK